MNLSAWLFSSIQNSDSCLTLKYEIIDAVCSDGFAQPTQALWHASGMVIAIV
jgi:hypothetical protein